MASYQGCSIFTAADAYNKDVTNASVDPKSATYIASMVSGGDNAGGFEASTGYERVNLANNGTPLVSVQPDVSYHPFPNRYPFLPTFFIEPAGDAHMMVLQTQTCHLYESYNTVYAGGTLSAYGGGDWDLTKPYARGSADGAAANAAGTPLMAGMVLWEQYQSGAINHALNFAPTQGSVARSGHVLPAYTNPSTPYVGSVSPQIPFGAHLRLRASFNISGFPPQARAVAQAMKTYGIFITDTGGACCPNQLYFANALNGSNPWQNSDLDALGNIHITDFDVLTLPPIQQ